MQVLLEVLRLYPPVVGISKQAMEGGIQLGEYFIPGGTSLFVSLQFKFTYLHHACGVIMFVALRIQWNLHKTDTIGEQPFGRYR